MEISDSPIMHRLKDIFQLPAQRMPIRDKTITAACRTPEGIEWTSIKIKQDGPASLHQGAVPITLSGDTVEQSLSSIELPDNVAEVMQGDMTVPLRASELLMRVVELPTSDETEIRDMVAFQIDKISPFPTDQMAMAHEVLQQNDGSALVLMAAAKRSCIDAIGDLFQEKGVHVHSIDARVMGWLKLLQDEEKCSQEGCEIIVIDDDIDFLLVVLNNGIPFAFRSLDQPEGEAGLVDELCREIGYTLTSLDAEYDLPAPTAIQFWHHGETSRSLLESLAAKSGLSVSGNDLDDLPPLSEGILRRAQANTSRIELIPREWVELQAQKQLLRKLGLVSGSMIAVWLVVIIILTAIYQTRSMALSRIQKQADAIAPAANQALANRQKLKKLMVYTDRSDSALECLREITRMLPNTDIELASFNYKKEKGVTVRGTADSDDTAYEFFDRLTASKLFSRLKDQSVTTKVTKGIQRAVFSATLELPAGEDAE